MTTALYVSSLLISGLMALLLGFMLGAMFMIIYQQRERNEDTSRAPNPGRSRPPGSDPERRD